MKTLIIHAGMPKTGSSALQSAFARARDVLLEHSLDYFPIGQFNQGLSGKITSGNGNFISRTLLNDKHEAYLLDNNDEYLNSLLHAIEVSDAENGLLSSEFFTNVAAPALGKFREVLVKKGITLKYSYYVRRQDQFLMSGYMQRVKRHHFTGYPEQFIRDTYRSTGFLNYYAFTKNICKVLGEENVAVRNFDVAKLESGGLLGDFLSSINIELPENKMPKDTIVNVSPSPREIKALLILNQFKPKIPMSDGIVEDSAKFHGTSYLESHEILEPDLCREILSHFGEGNKKLEREFLPKGHEFSSKINDDYINLEELELSANDVLNVLGSILVRLDKKIK